MDVSGFDGKCKALCENSMMFNAEHSGWFPLISTEPYPQFLKEVLHGDTYDDSTCCLKYSHNIGCFTYGPLIALFSCISGCVCCPFAVCCVPVTKVSTIVFGNTWHWMYSAPCLGACCK
jgi:hypothetical protein